MDMDMVRPWKDPWGLSPSLQPWKAWTVLTISVVALDPWDHLGRRVAPMLAVYATATVVVTVAAGTQCAWYGLTGPLDAKKWTPGPGNGYCIRYWFLDLFTGHTCQFLRNFIVVWGIITISVANWGHVEILTQVSARGGNPSSLRLSLVPAAMLGCDRGPPWSALRRGVKRYPGAHGP